MTSHSARSQILTARPSHACRRLRNRIPDERLIVWTRRSPSRRSPRQPVKSHILPDQRLKMTIPYVPNCVSKVTHQGGRSRGLTGWIQFETSQQESTLSPHDRKTAKTSMRRGCRSHILTRVILIVLFQAPRRLSPCVPCLILKILKLSAQSCAGTEKLPNDQIAGQTAMSPGVHSFVKRCLIPCGRSLSRTARTQSLISPSQGETPVNPSVQMISKTMPTPDV